MGDHPLRHPKRDADSPPNLEKPMNANFGVEWTAWRMVSREHPQKSWCVQRGEIGGLKTH